MGMKHAFERNGETAVVRTAEGKIQGYRHDGLTVFIKQFCFLKNIVYRNPNRKYSRIGYSHSVCIEFYKYEMELTCYCILTSPNNV